MKKLFFTLVMMSIAAAAFSQIHETTQFIKIGPVGAVNSTWLFNKNVSDGSLDLNYKWTFGGQIGLMFIFDFNEKVGLNASVLYSGHNQNYKGTDSLGNGQNTYTVNTRLRYVDIPVMVRLASLEQRSYFEIGPQIGFLMSATEDYSGTLSTEPAYSDKDVLSQFDKSMIAVVAGIGGTIDVSDMVTLIIGIRAGYSFTDITVKKSASSFTSLASLPGTSYANLAAHFDRAGDFNYRPTQRFWAGLMAGITFRLQRPFTKCPVYRD